jgi:hypothetical protein
VLAFDSAVAGNNHLPTCPVFHKVWGSNKNPEGLCMKFLTRGHSCTGAACKSPHICNIAQLPDVARKQFIEFVNTQPGLLWVEGKEPPGTT